ncbi:2'-5' RNA ligase family protein [Nocardia takedensis]|uniref:2'-5' RNA ligase family protein n=1 Tax=Nocardia takedensis TaxID=259390 RepID=UPI003F7742C1
MLAEIPTMAPVSQDGLHVTLQGIGFADEVSETDVDRIAGAATRLLAHHPPINLKIGPPIVDEETIQLPIADPTPLRRVRDDLQAAIAEIWGHDRVPEVGSPFRPHLTLAYSTGVTPIAHLARMLTRSSLESVTVDNLVTAVSLIELNRDNGRYEWSTLAIAPMTGR